MTVEKGIQSKTTKFIIFAHNYFKCTNFRGQKLSRILVQSAKVCPAKNSELLDPRKFMSAKCFKIGHSRKLMSTKNSKNRAYPQNLAMEKKTTTKKIEISF